MQPGTTNSKADNNQTDTCSPTALDDLLDSGKRVKTKAFQSSI